MKNGGVVKNYQFHSFVSLEKHSENPIYGWNPDPVWITEETTSKDLQKIHLGDHPRQKKNVHSRFYSSSHKHG